jgi:hypothetical protein
MRLQHDGAKAHLGAIVTSTPAMKLVTTAGLLLGGLLGAFGGAVALFVLVAPPSDELGQVASDLFVAVFLGAVVGFVVGLLMAAFVLEPRRAAQSNEGREREA